MPPAKPFILAKQIAGAPVSASIADPKKSSGTPKNAGESYPPAELGFPDPYKQLGEFRKVVVLKEMTQRTRMINCLLGVCGVTRYRYYVKDAVSGRDIFKCKFSYSSSCNVCAGGTRHNYTLDMYCTPLDGSRVLGRDSTKGLFISTASSENSPVATGGHGAMDMRSMETLGRVIPGPTGSITIKSSNQGIAFRIAAPINSGYGGATSEMLIEDGSTTALVGRIVKTWSKGDSAWCCGGSESPGPFLLDMTAVSNLKKRALLVVAAIIADATAFGFRAAPPVSLGDAEKHPLNP
jgi:hypothetical protein